MAQSENGMRFHSYFMTLKVQGIEVFRADLSLGRSVAVLQGVEEMPALRPVIQEGKHCASHA